MAQPVIGPSLTGVGRHWQTQLVLAVNFLKQLNRPIRLEDLAITSGIESLLHNYELLEALKSHDKVRYDSRTQLFQYKASLTLCPVLPLPVHAMSSHHVAHPRNRVFPRVS